MSDTMKLQCELDHKTQELAEQAEQITKWKDAFEEMSELYGNAVKKDFKQAEQIAGLKTDIERLKFLPADIVAENKRLKEFLADKFLLGEYNSYTALAAKPQGGE